MSTPGWGALRRRCSSGRGEGSPRRAQRAPVTGMAATQAHRARPHATSFRRGLGCLCMALPSLQTAGRLLPFPRRGCGRGGEGTTERSEKRPLDASIIGHNMGTVMSTLVGTCLNNRYRLDAQIGAGGMSTVYRAFDTTLERQVAVKLMHREIASDSDQLERFRREARSVAQL